MKNCPYCAEEILDAAIKCRYCNEWLDKKNPITNILDRARNFLTEKTTEFQKRKVEHIYLPLNNRPFEVGNIKLYPDDLRILGTTISLKSIKSIYYAGLMSEVNFIVDRKTIFIIQFEKEGAENSEYVIKLATPSGTSIIGPDFSKKTFEQLAFLNQYLSNSTLEQRLNNYLEQIKSKGAFIYDDHTFSTNGDILKDGKLIANILAAYDNDSIIFGSSWSGMKSKSNDPYQFVILSGAPRIRVFGFESGNKLKLQTHTDHDVFELLISHFVKYKAYPTY